MLDLAGLNQFLHRAGYIFDGHVRINPMLIQQVDGFNPQPLERPFDGLLDVLGLTIHTGRSRAIIVARTIAGTHVESKLGGNDHTVADGR